MPNQSQTCAICQRQPEDLLVLACGHNLCLMCATQIYQINQKANPLVCQICLVETELDLQTISCFKNALSDKQNNLQINAQDNIYQLKAKKTKSKPPLVKSPTKQRNKTINICKLHNQASIYYCFVCNDASICSQCILTNKHNSHRVLTTKKAAKQFEQGFKQNSRLCQQRKHQYEDQRQYIRQKKTECMKDFNTKRQQVKTVFQELARYFSQKYSQICISIQKKYKECETIYEAFVADLNEKIKILQETSKFYKNININQLQTISNAIPTMGSLKDMKDDHRLITQLPKCCIQVPSTQQLMNQIQLLLNRFAIQVCNASTTTNTDTDSLINEKDGKQFQQQPSRIVLKQSCRRSIDPNPNLKAMRMDSSRKIDMNRSIQNATYIINRLQQRSKIE